MRRLQLSMVIGIACALLLTMIRGGWRDLPLVVLIFGVAGFSITYAVASIVNSGRLASIEAASNERAGIPLLRNLAAIALITMSFAWSGQVIQGAGFSGWLVALFLGVVFPLVVCVLASRWEVVFGLLAATSLAISTLVHHPMFRGDIFAADAWEHLWQRDAGVWLFIWGVLATLSLAVSVPLAVRRRRLTFYVRNPGT